MIAIHLHRSWQLPRASSAFTRRSPLPVLAFLLSAIGLSAGLPRTAVAQPLPTAENLIARHVAAIGGAEAFKALTSIRQIGVMEMPSMGLTAQAENLAAAPNKVAMKATIPGIGEIASGTDGELAWQLNPLQGPRMLVSQELAEAREAADFYANLLMTGDRYAKIETVELTDFNGEKAYKVKATRKLTGKESLQYFSVSSGLLIGSQLTQESAMGSTFLTTVLSDYKDFGGRKFPTRSESTVGANRIVMTIRDVTVNDVPAAAFAVPEAIQALVRK